MQRYLAHWWYIFLVNYSRMTINQRWITILIKKGALQFWWRILYPRKEFTKTKFVIISMWGFIRAQLFSILIVCIPIINQHSTILFSTFHCCVTTKNVRYTQNGWIFLRCHCILALHILWNYTKFSPLLTLTLTKISWTPSILPYTNEK